ncbi:hypothetical protein AL485_02510 [Serratia liquefaciens]|uniref:hypothetical protein n=1 Tax=Serratia liquefaciens TaxID=614 RepID=UPI0006612BFA|nr:hypothetical protein [Serratia liquefaciens]AMG98126.1 hypothetical protein AL485_02510 [Serratia liquefaciens]
MLKRFRSMYESHIKAELNIYSVGMLFMFAISMLLLLFGFLSGAEFVAFVIASAVLAIIIKMLPEISEFSLAGNTVKLKQKLDEAQRLTDELKSLKLSTLRTLFQLLLRHPGGFAASYGDGRLPDFINFFEEVKDTEYEREFTEDMLKYAEVFKATLEQQLTSFNTKEAGGERLSTYDLDGIEWVKRDLPKINEIITHLKKNAL